MAKLLSRSRIIAIVDIGSGHIGCSFLSCEPSGVSRVLATGHSPLTLEDRLYVQSRARIADEIDQAAQAARAAAGEALRGQHIAEVRVMLHVPWVSSSVVTASSAFEKRTPVESKDIAALAKQTLASSHTTGKLLERAVLTFRLNGYPTHAPEGKRASSIGISVIITECDAALRSSIENAMHASFPNATVTFASAKRAYTTVLNRLGYPADAFVVDVGVDATHLFVLRDGDPVAEHTVSEGLRSILARVHGAESPEDTLGLFRLYARDACESDACLALQKAVATIEPDLVKVFGEGFAALAEKRRLPNTLVLIAHPDVEKWLASFFERIDFTQFTITSLPFVTRVLAMRELGPWISGDQETDARIALACTHAVIEEQST